mgnify:CR=1 FL=1
MRNLKKFSKYIFLAFICLFIDQAIKYYCSKNIALMDVVPLSENISLTHTRNFGIIGEHYSQYPKGERESYTLYWPLTLLLMLTVLALKRFSKCSFFERLGYTFMLAGGVSNLRDHWIYHHVIDTFSISFLESKYQPLNFADLLLVTGATLLFISYTFLWFQSQGKIPQTMLIDPDYWTANRET